MRKIHKKLNRDRTVCGRKRELVLDRTQWKAVNCKQCLRHKP